jgi:hypothetical protein
MCLLQQAMPAPPLKRSRSPSIDAEPQPQPLPTRDLPVVVWEAHLLRLLTCKDAARLGCTCKALRVVVRERFKDIGTIDSECMQAALTTFPRARSVTFDDYSNVWEHVEREALLQWLCEGGRGRHLEGITVEYPYSPAMLVIHEALQAGALPSLKRLDARLDHETQRALLRQGFLLGGMHELRLNFHRRDADWLQTEPQLAEPQLAALGLVRQLPALTRLELAVSYRPDEIVEWPPFIPPSLKALHIGVSLCGGPGSIESLLGALPGMLEASGARLDRLEVYIPHFFERLGDGLVHLAQVLRCCSPTLKSCSISVGFLSTLHADPLVEEEERLRVQWADVLAGVSACRELQVLKLPSIKVEPLFPPGTAFARLTHLEICDHERQHPPVAGVMGLWEVMASGGLPALAKLSVRLEGRRGWVGLEEVRSRMAPAFEAVAGTLTHLHLSCGLLCGSRSDEVEVGYEVGVAVGKLRRLKDLALVLSRDGRVYHAFAQGLVAGGGDRPLPLLWRVMLPLEVKTYADQAASLLLPSVQVFDSDHHGSTYGALVTACALRQAGYKHTWTPRCSPWETEERMRDLRRVLPWIALGCCRLLDARVETMPPPWVLSPEGRLPSLGDDET